MPKSQETPIPVTITKLRFRDTGWLVNYAVRGFAELVRARIVFATLKASDIAARNASNPQQPARGERLDMQRLARIAYVIPRLSCRLPWRSDCVIQAIAAQNWLKSKGLVSEIRIGVQRPQGAHFHAHAWLACDGVVITGGDISAYHLLVGNLQDCRKEDA